jgi:hypothetical protein
MSIFSFIPLELKIHIASIYLKDDNELVNETCSKVFNYNLNNIPYNNIEKNTTGTIFFTNAWYKLTQIDDEFKNYSKTNAGIKLFINLFTITLKNDNIYATTLFGELHSINDEPAYYSKQHLWYNNIKMWFFNGKVHRGDDFPAITYTTGTRNEKWYKNGLLHRDGDLPAIIRVSESFNCQIWYKNGKRHREADPDRGDLPALINNDGVLQEWWINGEHYRDDKPVIIYDKESYYKNDIKYSCNDNVLYYIYRSGSQTYGGSANDGMLF